MKLFPLLLLMALFSSPLFAGIREERVIYRDGDTELEGFVAMPDKVEGKLPVVLVVHDWSGLGPYAENRARMLAELGYLAFAVDVYGKGVRPEDPAARRAEAGKYKSDRNLFRQRLRAALDAATALPQADPNRVAAIGYCFGGGGVLELVRDGAPVKGVVSFHGSLDALDPAKPGVSQAKVLVCHGNDDPVVPPAQVAAFYEEMRKAGIDYQLIAYSGAVHSFTNPGAGDDPSKGSAYQEAADRRSWEHMKQFLQEVLK